MSVELFAVFRLKKIVASFNFYFEVTRKKVNVAGLK